MAWMRGLLTDERSVATSILVLVLTIVLGLAIGGVRFRGIRFGAAGVLFGGLLLGHFGLRLQPAVADFAREFGLVLFIYAVGMAVGPSFFHLFRAYGLKTNSFAVATIVLGTLTAWISVRAGGVAPEIAVGVLAGATTNTPSLAAATQTLAERPPEPEAARAALEQIGVDGSRIDPHDVRHEVGKLPGLGYAVAYPSGVFGIILSFLILQRLFGIDPVDDARRMEREFAPAKPPLERRAVRLTRSDVAGQTVDHLAAASGASVVVSRIRREGRIFTAIGSTLAEIGDELWVVGPADDLERFRAYVGESADPTPSEPCDVAARWIIVSKPKLVGRTVGDAEIAERFHVRLTRVRRGGVELLSFDDLRLAFGDGLLAVGGAHGLAALADEAGDVERDLDVPRLLPMFFGIALGIVVGAVPLAVPGLSTPLKIGLAGGPLLTALALAHVRRIGGLVFHLPAPAGAALKELGITVFLAAVGLKAGSRFLATLTQGDGVWWLAWGAAITLVPLLAVGITAIAVFRAPYTAVIGVLAGGMTDPPALAFAESLTKSEGASLAYASVYPAAMILRIILAQIFLIVCS